MRELQLGSASTRMVFMADAADHISGLAGLTLTITASKAGGPFALITPVVVDRGNGWYAIALTAVHTDTLGDLALHITAPGADPSDALFMVTDERATLDAIETKTKQLGTGSVVLNSPLQQNGNVVEVEIVRGDTYEAAGPRGALEWTDAGELWPDLTGATIQLTVREQRLPVSTPPTEPPIVLAKAGTVLVPSGPGKQVRVELTEAETAAAGTGSHEYDVQATLPDGDRMTLAGPRWPFLIVPDQTIDP